MKISTILSFKVKIYNPINVYIFLKCLPQAGNLRVWGLKPGGFRQPLTPGCQKKYSQPYRVPLMIDFARCILKKR